jgi:hypothetical protein
MAATDFLYVVLLFCRTWFHVEDANPLLGDQLGFVFERETKQ